MFFTKLFLIIVIFHEILYKIPFFILKKTFLPLNMISARCKLKLKIDVVIKQFMKLKI